MGGLNTIVLHNTCEDSLLAAPLIIDLVILTELFERVTIREMDADGAYVANDSGKLHPVLSLLSYLLKAPMVAPGTPVVNALFKQVNLEACNPRPVCSCPTVSSPHSLSPPPPLCLIHSARQLLTLCALRWHSRLRTL